MSKSAIKSKTIWLNAIVAMLAFVELNFNLLEPYLGPHAGLMMMALGIVNIGLRMVTTQPISMKRSSADKRGFRYDDYHDHYDLDLRDKEDS